MPPKSYTLCVLNQEEAVVLAVVRAARETLLSRHETVRRSGLDAAAAETAIAGLLCRRLIAVTDHGGFVTLTGFV